MTAPRPYVDQESYKLLANKATLNQGTVDIFFRTFCNIFRLLLNCAPVRPGTPLCAPMRPVLKNIRKSYNLMFKGSFTL